MTAGMKRWFILGLATASQVSVAIIRMGFPALLPFIKDELSLSRAQVGLVSSVLNGGAAASGIPAGKASDHFGERWVIGYGAIVSGVIIIGVNWTGSFMTLLPLLFVIGFATGSAVPAGIRAVIGWFPRQERGLAMGVRQMGIPLGGSIAAMTLPPLAILFGWRVAFIFTGAVAVGIGIAALALYEEPPANLPQGGPAASGIQDLLKRKEIWAVMLFSFIFGGAQWCYLTYLELYLIEILSYSITLASSLLALGQLSGAAGRILWGFLSDRFFGGRRTPVLLLIGSLAVVMTLWTSTFSPQHSLGLVAGVVTLLGLTLQGWNGLAHTLISELAGTRVAGLATGLNNSFGFIGVIVLPPLYGLLVDQTHSYRLAWIVLAGVIFAALSSLLWIDEEKP
jgi:sugar phosphate permease